MKRNGRSKLWIALVIFGFFGLLVGCGNDPVEDTEDVGIADTGGDSDDTGDPEEDAGDLDDSSLGLTFSTEPPATITAGDSFEVVVSLVDEDDQAAEMGGLEIVLELNDSEFSTGDAQATSLTNTSGVATFSLTIEVAHTGLILTATTDHDDFEDASANTDPFDVVAADPSTDTSWISGDNGVPADGESEAEITIEILDEFSNPVAGITPEFTASGDGNDYGSCSETDDQGLATCSMTSTEDGEKTLEITEPLELIGETIEFMRACDSLGIPFGGGDGTTDDPYRICAPAQLNAVGSDTDFRANSFALFSDIDMGQVNDFNVIGDNPNPFQGSFNGAGFAISNLTIDQPGDDNIGFFGRTGSSSVIENVALEDIQVNGFDNSGGLVGLNQGEITASYVTGNIDGGQSGGLVGGNVGKISDSYSTADVAGSDHVGGLVSVNSDPGEIINSYATGSVDGTSNNIGGLVGSNTSIIENSYATGDVTGVDQIGGLVGSHNASGEIIDSHATGDVAGNSTIGGLIGRTFGPISDSYATGNVDGTGDNVGGLGGSSHINATITNSYAEGAVHSEGSDVGGLVGSNEGLITGSYAIGMVDGDSLNVGGLAGTNVSDATIEDSYATGDVFGAQRRVGGLVGRNQGAITGSYATGNASTDSRNVGGLVGVSVGSISDSYAIGDAALTGTPHDDVHSAGGLVGQNNGSVENSYATGEATGDYRVGGLMGWNLNTDITACYWDEDTSTMSVGVGEGDDDEVTGLATGAFDDEGSFQDWSFTDTWVIDTAPDGEERPILQWQ